MGHVRLTGYRYSVYSWVARLTLHEKGVPYDWEEVDPFDRPLSEEFLTVSPFGTVPVLDHDGFTLSETRAIAQYIDDAFEGPMLTPQTPKQRARQSQMISILDGRGYWPMVRQVYSHAVFRRRFGELVMEEDIVEGLEKSRLVLSSLEGLASGEAFLVGSEISLVDLHLFPHFDYLGQAAEGMALIQDAPKLSAWFNKINARICVRETRPQIP